VVRECVAAQALALPGGVGYVELTVACVARPPAAVDVVMGARSSTRTNVGAPQCEHTTPPLCSEVVLRLIPPARHTLKIAALRREQRCR